MTCNWVLIRPLNSEHAIVSIIPITGVRINNDNESLPGAAFKVGCSSSDDFAGVVGDRIELSVLRVVELLPF